MLEKADGLTQPADTAAPLDKYLERARHGRHRPNGDLCHVFRWISSCESRIAGIVARNPRHLLGFAFVHPLADKGRVDTMVREAVAKWDSGVGSSPSSPTPG